MDAGDASSLRSHRGCSARMARRHDVAHDIVSMHSSDAMGDGRWAMGMTMAMAMTDGFADIERWTDASSFRASANLVSLTFILSAPAAPVRQNK